MSVFPCQLFVRLKLLRGFLVVSLFQLFAGPVAIKFRSHTYVCARGPFIAFGVEFLIDLCVFLEIETGCGKGECSRSCDMIERAEPAFGLQV